MKKKYEKFREQLKGIQETLDIDAPTAEDEQALSEEAIDLVGGIAIDIAESLDRLAEATEGIYD